MSASRSTIGVTLLATLVLAGSAASGAASAQPGASAAGAKAHAARHYTHIRGRITSTNRSHGWFAMRTTTNRTVRIYTNRGTHWDGCDWDDMGYGHHVQVGVYRSHGRWMASRMQNWRQWGNGGWGHMPGWSHGGWGGPMMGRARHVVTPNGQGSPGNAGRRRRALSP